MNIAATTYILLWIVLVAYFIYEADLMNSEHWNQISIMGLFLRVAVGLYTIGIMLYILIW